MQVLIQAPTTSAMGLSPPAAAADPPGSSTPPLGGSGSSAPGGAATSPASSAAKAPSPLLRPRTQLQAGSPNPRYTLMDMFDMVSLILLESLIV